MHASIQRLAHPRAVTAALLSALLLSLSACASTQVVDRWRDPSFQGPPLHSVLVVGLQQDQGQRRSWEDSTVAALLSLGVAATPSYQILSGPAPKPDQLSSTAARGGFDAVMATHLVTTRSQPYWISGNPGLGFGSRWRYFDYWDATRGTGYVQPQSQSDYRTDLFTVGPNGGKLIWTGTTRSLDRSSIQAATEQICRALVPALQQAGILSRQKT
jgi:hypothetical protein